MPTLEEITHSLLASADFLPGLSVDERTAKATAIASKQLAGEADSPILFQASEDEQPNFIVIKANGKPSMVMFKNAVLARAEVNSNGDELGETEIAEISASIANWPINIEHGTHAICGSFSGGRPSKDKRAALVDGAIWADRYPDEAQGVMDGVYQLSIEAKAEKATCSMCGKTFIRAADYCEHLTNRKSVGAKRKLENMASRGGAITRRPAGTNTKFNPNEIYIVASHEEVLQESPMMTEQEILALQAKAAKLETDLAASVALVATKDGEIATAKASLTAAETTVNELRASVRRGKLGASLTDEDWAKQKDIFVSMPDVMFDLVASKMTAPPKDVPAPKPGAFVMPTGAAAGADRLQIG